MRQRTSTFLTDHVAVGGTCRHQSRSCTGGLDAPAVEGTTSPTIRTHSKKTKRRTAPPPSNACRFERPDATTRTAKGSNTLGAPVEKAEEGARPALNAGAPRTI